MTMMRNSTVSHMTDISGPTPPLKPSVSPVDSLPTVAWKSLVLVCLASVILAIILWYVGEQPVIHDANGYYQVGRLIYSRGIIHYGDPGEIIGVPVEAFVSVRTYGYASLLALLMRIFGDDVESIHRAAFVMHLCCLIGATMYSAIRCSRVVGRASFSVVFAALILVNPMVLAQATTTLTEIVSLSLTLVAFALLVVPRADVWPKSPPMSVLLAVFVSAFSVMIRPGNTLLFVLSLMVGLVLLRSVRFGPVWILVMLVVSCIPFVPQVMANWNAFGVFNPLPMANPYAGRPLLGLGLLKYGTIVIPDQPIYLQYPNPFLEAQDKTLFGFFLRDPVGLCLSVFFHGFALVDPDFLFTYITDLRPWYRWPVSLLSYSLLALACFGWATGMLRIHSRRHASLLWTSLLFAGVYVGVYLLSIPEFRFSIPLYGFGAIPVYFALRVVASWVSAKAYQKVALFAVGVSLVCASGVWLSTWMQARALLCDPITGACAPLVTRGDR